MSEQIQIAIQATGEVRTETVMDREFSVFPAVIVQEQVLQNNLGRVLLPFTLIQENVDAWNGIPVVVTHPTFGGKFISARSPGVLNSIGVGSLFNAQAVDGELKVEVFIDNGRIEEVEGTAKSIQQVANGEGSELSTGFGTTLRKEKGTFDGREFDAVMTAMVPDHLALLPNATGACSVDDGCGLGVNEEKSEGLLKKALNAFRRLMGWNESDEEKREEVRDALRAAFGGPDSFVWPVAMFSDEGRVIFEVEDMGTGIKLFEVSFELGESGVTLGEPVEVERVTTFKPVTSSGDLPVTEVSSMSREEMVASLVAAGLGTEAVLNELTDCKLKAFVAANSDEPVPTPEPAETGDFDALSTKVDGLVDVVQKMSEAVGPAINAQKAERDALVAALVANDLCPIEEASLNLKGIDELLKLQSMARGQIFTGAAGVVGPALNNGAHAEDDFAPVSLAWASDGEAN